MNKPLTDRPAPEPDARDEVCDVMHEINYCTSLIQDGLDDSWYGDGDIATIGKHLTDIIAHAQAGLEALKRKQTMRIVAVKQQTEEWDRWRNRPTASEFHDFITPVRGEYSSQATAYAAKIVAKRLGVYIEPPPTWAMERGTELEPSAKLAYTKQTGLEVTDVGFIVPDNTDAYGGSPDGLVGDEGGLEVKCPLPERLIRWLADGEMPVEFRPQVQGLLFISGRKWWDFVGFDPALPLLIVRIEPDLDYHEKIADGLLQLLREIERIESRVKRVKHELVLQTAGQDDVKWA